MNAPPRNPREWAVLVDQVRRHRERLTARLIRNTKVEGSCLVWVGACGSTNGGYPKMNFRHNGRHVQIDVHRLFLMLMDCAPIPEGIEAGHYFCHNARCVVHVERQTRSDNLKARDDKEKDCPF